MSHALAQLDQLTTQRLDLATLLQEIDANSEPYCMASHRGAYAARSYQTLRDYEPFEELSDAQKRAVLRKLDNPTSFHVSTFPPSDARGDGHCGDAPAVLNPLTWHFESACPCAAHNFACSPRCGPPSCGNQLGRCEELQINRDLAIRDSWGIDCYTRNLIQKLLKRSGVSDELVEVFIQQSLLPAVSILPREVAHDLR